MSYRIGFITSHYLCQSTREALARMEPDFEYMVVPYDNFSHITQVYEEYADSCDGFMISGQSAVNIVQRTSRRPIKPMVPFQIDAAALYRALLGLCVNKRTLDLNRVLLDASIPFGKKNSIAEFLTFLEDDSYQVRFSDYMSQTDLSEISRFEEDLIDRIQKLWDQNSFDLLICEYTSIIPALEARHIPYLHPHISDVYFSNMIRSLLVRIELENLRSNLPSYLCLIPGAGTISQEQKEQLKEAAASFFAQNLITSPIEDNSGILCAELTAQNVRYLTQNGTACMVTDFLNSRLDIPAVAGYGIGSRPDQALNHALAAVKEAALRGHSFLKDETGDLVGPLGTGQVMVLSTTPPADVGRIAHQCGLSAITIQKLMTFMQMSGSDKITSHDLSEQFDVTVRNANRILSRLSQSGYADVVYTQADGTKGRPVKVYELKFREDPHTGHRKEENHYGM